MDPNGYDKMFGLLMWTLFAGGIIIGAIAVPLLFWLITLLL